MVLLSEVSAQKYFSPAKGERGGVSTVFIDFDGTICPHDVTDALLAAFAPGQWEAMETDWLAGKIGARECLARQIALIKAAPADISALLNTMQIDADFKSFTELLCRQSIPAIIVSDGLDYSINHILRAHALENISVFSNRLLYCGKGRWQVEFPYQAAGCPAGHCKCRRFHLVEKGGLTVYIGDGASDFCPAQKADIVFAKGKLAEFYKKQGIEHFEIENFADVLKLWAEQPWSHAEPSLKCDSRQGQAGL